MSVLALALLILAVATSSAHAASADLDPGFAGDGTLTTALELGWTPTSLDVQENGAIVIAGRSILGITVLRLLPDGAPDPSFGGGDGLVGINTSPGFEQAADVQVQRDGRLLVGGIHTEGPGDVRLLLVRLLANGEPDPALNADGDADGVVAVDLPGPFEALTGVIGRSDGTIWGSGRIDVAGDARGLLARLHENGALDVAYDGNGYRTTTFPGVQETLLSGLEIDGNGRMLTGGFVSDASGLRQAYVRYTTAGGLDASFNGDGRALADPSLGDDALTAVTATPGNAVVGVGIGYVGTRAIGTVGRLDAAGERDDTFGTFGTTQIAPPGTDPVTLRGVADDPEGGVVTVGQLGAGMAARLLVARLRPDGTLDPAFDGDGLLVADVAEGTNDEGAAAAVTDAGRILALGGFYSGVSNELTVLGLRGWMPPPTPPVDSAGGGAAPPAGTQTGAALGSPAAPAGPAPTPRPTRDTTAPRVTQARLVRARTRRGQPRLRIAVSEAATVRVALVRRATGQRTRTLTRRVRRAGRLHVVLSRRGLRAGAYRAVVTASDAAGNRSAARTVRFRVARRR